MRLHACLLALLLPLSAHAATLRYVSPAGSDSANGSQAAPWRTIGKAASSSPQYTVIDVAAGLYPEFVTLAVPHVVLHCEAGAVLVPPAGSNSGIALTLKGAWDATDGCTIDGASVPNGLYIGVYSAGPHDQVLRTTVHDIAQTKCDSQGAGGIVTSDYYGGAQNDVVASLVYNVGLGAPGCNLDHGIYPQTTGRISGNEVHDVASWGITTWHNATGVAIEGNTIARAGSGCIDIGSQPPTANNFSVIGNQLSDCPYGVNVYGYVGAGSYTFANIIGANVAVPYNLTAAVKQY